MWTVKPPLGWPLQFGHWQLNGLLGWWLFQEGDGDKVNDLSNNGNTGTLTNMASPSTVTSGWNPGRNGRCITVDGTDDYINTGDLASIDGLAQISVSVWFRPGSATGSTNNNKMIVAKWTPGVGYQFAFGYEAADNNLLAFAVRTGGTGGAGASKLVSSLSTVADPTKWYYLTGVYNGATVKIYINGVEDNSATGTGTINTGVSSILAIAAYSTPSGYVSGSIDDVRIYNKGLLANEIIDIYSNQFGAFEGPDPSAITKRSNMALFL